MSFGFSSFGRKNSLRGSTFGLNQDSSFSSRPESDSQLNEGSNLPSLADQLSNTDSSMDLNNNASKFGTGSLRKSSSFRLGPNTGNNSNNNNNQTNTSASDVSNALPNNEVAASFEDSPNLNVDLSKSALSTPSSQPASLSSNKQHLQFSCFQGTKPASNIKKLVINHDSASNNSIVRSRKRSRKSSTEFGLQSPSLASMASSANSSASSTPNKHRKLNSSTHLSSAFKNPAISRIYEINKTAVDSGYWISPSLETLFAYTFDQLKAVKDLQIGRKNHGTIRYIDPVDLSTINNLSDILGNLVVFGHLTVCVYPEEANGGRHAPPGQELNKPAIITLENVFTYVPVGKSKMKLTDPSDPRVKPHTDRFNERIKARGGEFITYDVASGIYVFKVQHFSSWGFDENDLIYDEEDEEMEEFEMKKETKGNDFEASGNTPQQLLNNVESNNGFHTKSGSVASGQNDFAGFSLNTPDSAATFQRHLGVHANQNEGGSTYQSSPALSSFQNTPQKKFQLNNSALVPFSNESVTGSSNGDFGFADEPRRMTNDFIQNDDCYKQALALYDSNSRHENGSVADNWIDQLSHAATFDSTFAISNSELEIAKSDSKVLSKPNLNSYDLDNLIFGGSSQLNLSSTAGHYRKAAEALRLPDPSAPFSFAKFSSSALLLKDSKSPSSFVNGTSSITESISSQVQNILKDLLFSSQIDARETGFPVSKPSGGLTFDYLKQKLSGPSHSFNVISLASVLFDDLKFHGIEPLPASLSKQAAEKQTEKYRAQLLSQWLSTVVAPETSKQIASAANNSLNKALAYLYGNQITNAALAASKGGNLHLASLIPLLGSPSQDIKALAKSQIEEWRAQGFLGYIPASVRIIFELISGNTNVSKGLSQSHDTKAAPELNISQGLSWLQAFGLRLWYESTAEKSISEAVDCYEKAFSTQGSTVPKPYVNSNTRHAEFELLSLYKSSGSNLCNLFNPVSSSGSSFDYQVSWLLYHVLVRSLALFEDSDSKIGDKLSLGFATQLEAQEKYLEAVFVLSHISQDFTASQAIEDLIVRNITKLSNADVEILTKTLKISPTVFNNAHALKYRYSGDYWKESEQLIIAGNFEEAHYRILHAVAPKAVISNDLDRLLTLLLSFKSPESISNWSRGGQIYLDYIYIVETMTSAEQNKFSEVDGQYFPVSMKFTGDRARRAYASSGMSALDVGLRLLKGLGDVELSDSFDIKVAVNLMAAFISKHIKALGLISNSSLALQMNVDAATYLQNTVQLSGYYFLDKVSAA